MWQSDSEGVYIWDSKNIKKVFKFASGIECSGGETGEKLLQVDILIDDLGTAIGSRA